MRSMPPTWRMAKLGICLQRRKDTVMPSTLNDGTVGLVGLEDIQDGGRGGVSVRPTAPQKIGSLKTRFDAGDILYGKLRPYLNKVGIAQKAGLCSTEIWAFGPSSLVDRQFAAFFLASSFFVDRVVSLMKGANLPRLDAAAFDSIEIPLPPLSEQHRIVEMLREAEAIRRLRAEAEVKASELVPAMFDALFGDPATNPKNWRIQPLGSVINDTPKNGLYKPADLYGDGTPIIRIGDFSGGILDSHSNLQRVRISEDEIEQFGVSAGQILVNRVNSIEHLGKSVLIGPLNEPTVFESNMMRLDPKTTEVLPGYLICCLQHNSVVAKLRAKAKKAINQASINQTDLRTLEIPVPPLSEQEAFLSLVAACEEVRTLSYSSRHTEVSVSGSVTANAFSGQLTAAWREAHAAQLAAEAHRRDTTLAQLGTALSRPRSATIPEDDGLAPLRADGNYSQLNREQRTLLTHIHQQLRDAGDLRYFTAETLSRSLEGPLRRNPQAVDGHLTVLAARGLIIPLSREEQTEDTAEFVFGNAYRLPLQDRTDRLTDESGNALIIESGEHLVTEGAVGDHARGRELERLAAQLQKERELP